MTLREYLKENRGFARDFALEMGITPAAVSHWATGYRNVPVEYCARLEAATGGAVTRQSLRPNDWHLIWPELADGKVTAKQISDGINPNQGAEK